MTFRLAIVLACLAVAAIPLLLLNGQTFTNSLVSLAALAAAIGTCTAALFDRRVSSVRKQHWGAVVLVMVILALVLVVKLPATYRFQQQFNEKVQQVRVDPRSSWVEP
jgi:hypothetical protein